MKRDSGYTLFEVILSLMLVTVILMMVTTAINMHLSHLTSGRMQTEEARLVRAIFDRIARDIRHVVISQQDDSENSASEDPTSETDENGYDEYATDMTTNSGRAPEFGFVGQLPGIYGGTDWIQIDTKRILFGERFATENTRNIMIQDDMKHDRLSERKTSLYYLGEDTGSVDADEEIARGAEGSIAAPESPDQEYEKPAYKYGLYYRSLDRLIAEYAEDNGDDVDFKDDDEPIAPEVDDIEFLYYDGEEWLSEWDMDENRTLPVAVRVILTVRRKDYDTRNNRDFSDTSTQNRRVIVYSLTIPTSIELLQVAEEETTE